MMPGSTSFFSEAESEEVVKPPQGMIGTREAPPIAPRTTNITLESWEAANNANYAKSASTDSLESTSSSSSGGCSRAGEYIPTRTVGKMPKLASHNPLQFVKVQSPLYKKAEQQIKLTKEVKITREELKEGEEDWQSNLDNWKSRRRKVSEKVIQRAEEMRQIEAEEQFRQEKLLQQQKKIKKFSEIVEKKSTRSYNLELYVSQGDDSGLGGTPEPDDILDCQSSHLRSDTSEGGMTSEAESVDSDIHKLDKNSEKKEPPKVPQKPNSRFKKSASISCDCNEILSNELFQQGFSGNVLQILDHNSSDIEGHAGDTEGTSSEEDGTFSAQTCNVESALDSLGNNLLDSSSDLSKDSCSALGKIQLDFSVEETEVKPKSEISSEFNQCFKLFVKHGDMREFGLMLKGGKDQGYPAYIENIVTGSPADKAGLKEGDKIISLNGDLTSDYSHASLVFSIRQAAYTGSLDVVINRKEINDNMNSEIKPKEERKRKSFAEKLAMFSSCESYNKEEPKTNTKTIETKPESLVLRRRSTFENGNTENVNVVNRRSSCFTYGIDTDSEKSIENRRSLDLTFSQNIMHKENMTKKGPPPPVPVKPKIKSKPIFSEIKKYSSIKLNDTISISSKCDTVSNDVNNDLQKSFNDYENSFLTNEKLELNSKTANSYEGDNEVVCPDNLFNVTVNTQTTDECLDCNVSEEMIKTECTNYISNVSAICDGTSLETQSKTDDVFGIETDFLITEDLEKQTNCSFQLDSEFTKPSNTFVSIINAPASEVSLYHDVEITDQTDIQNNATASPNIVDHFQDETNLDVNIARSACNSSSYVLEDSIEIDFNAKDCVDDLSGKWEDTENNHTKVSPLHLSLEKIEEDDVISASTTTSSDTPDTETVIETLPSNISPLPNDESNGEDSTKVLIYQDKKSHPITEATSDIQKSSNEKYSETEINIESENPDVIDLSEAPDDVFIENCNSATQNINSVMKNSYHEIDDEYTRELDESLDQITSLDIIDRIEQSLMDQLQKEDTFEVITENLNTHIEDEINSSWLYFPKESAFLEDLSPQKLEPPRDPPPPPPPPEPESAETNAMSSSCTDSTKRIKKELLRRRSDFLGLDSHESIDMGKIPPPPPGLEELLKQEREQTQWLEKQLSLADPEIQIFPYEVESTCYNDYSAEYFEHENLSKDYLSSEHKNWSGNVDPETAFDASYGFQYEQDLEQINTNIEKHDNSQNKTKQNIQSLGAAPKAKIVDSTNWITEKAIAVNKKTIEPVVRQMSCNQNYRLIQDGEKKRNFDSPADRRYSMPPVYSNPHPDVTVRTWKDREYEQYRPRLAIYDKTKNEGNIYDEYMNIDKKKLQRTQSLDSQRDHNFDTDTLESEVHKCSCCGKGLCEGSAMGIEALRLYFHIECFRCCMCQIQLGNGSCGTDVQVKNNQLYCPACFTVD